MFRRNRNGFSPNTAPTAGRVKRKNTITSVAYTDYNLVDTAKQWYDWNGNAYPSVSPYGGELGNRYASDARNKKFTILNKLNLEYLIGKQHTINFNSYFAFADGYPKDDMRELSIGKKAVFDSKMQSWTRGLTYDFRSGDDRFLNSLTARYYLYTMNTRSASIFGLGDKDVNLNKSDFGINDALRYRFMPDLMGKLSAGYDVRIPSETELLGDGYTISPSEALLPERNTSVNIGMLYDLTGKKPSNLQIEINGFFMYLQNMIRYTKGIIGAQYQNFGEMRTIGVEAEVKADITR